MATKIRETPILKGKEAEAFTKQIKANESRSVPAADYKRAMNTYRRVVRPES